MLVLKLCLQLLDALLYQLRLFLKVALLNGKSIHDNQQGDFVCHVGIHNGPTNPKAKKLLNEYMSMPQNLKKEAELVEKCIQKLETELEDEHGTIAEGIEVAKKWKLV